MTESARIRVPAAGEPAVTKPDLMVSELTRAELQPPCDMTWPRTTGKCSKPATHILLFRCGGACNSDGRCLVCYSCASRALTRKTFTCRFDGASSPWTVLSLELL